MSAASASTVRAPRAVPRPSERPAPRPAPPAPRLRVVQAPAHGRTRVPFVLLCMAVLAAGLLGALLLNTTMAQGEYQRYELQTRLARSAQEQQRLTAELELAAAPAALATAARDLGMVPTTGGAYLRLSDGAVLGNPVPAGAGR
ncbi:hypothetical protein [Actinotalea sp.]|uniref:hypothetical protein n=1 Tax=Actinotalea sp. TaxID=1872145 RepID=UPI002C256405|nr:hypothetical protein [Actinotalea sp.]HQY33427.1 hypothetical protein [Actinotalea sp.]HRA49771.1 hypothetical protein [Actinotalea sp.]